MMSKKPWWWPTSTDEKYIEETRSDYPEDTKDMSDEDIVEHYAEGCRYATTWDHAGDAYAEYEPLVDAFLKLVEQSGKKPSDFL